MRIAMISPLEIRVPPITYGGIELVVSLLTEALIRRGHDITLFASGDSVTSAKLISVCPQHLRGQKTPWEKNILEMLNVIACLERSSKFDIIHNHSFPAGVALAGFSAAPVLTTLHDHLEGENLSLFLDYQGWYNTISQAVKSLLPEKEKFVGVIHNAIDVESFPFNKGEREGYLLFLARLAPDKGPHLAIEVARRLKRRLVIAGNTDEVNGGYYRKEVEPQIDGDLIQYFGEADPYQKRQLLSQADCLLAPITWPEPFGLYFIEAMAAGVPVITCNLGAAPEIVKHGKTGFLVNGDEEVAIGEMVAAVKNVPHISREYCRKYVEERFDVPRMVDDYLRAYKHIINHS